MELFQLQRDEDESGVSGTGVVAEGIKFTNGVCVVNWTTPHRSLGIFDSVADLVAIHGHGGKTRVVFFDTTKDICS